ncbi:hypothetical protein HAZT_HAZT001625 [Hyalella azteca]|nr:hypothetical protein HAZT_HAZT001625 [Hyalella azteca]
MEAEFTDSDDSGDDEDFVEESNLETDDNCQVVKPKVCEAEDIYGRLRDSEGNVIEENTGTKVSSYLTPEQRKHDETLQEQLRDDAIKRVRTQLRGRLNRLAEVNLAGTVTMVCSLYGNHPRHLLNVVFSELLLAELASEMLTLDRHCQECAVLLAAVASNVAEEIGAHILTDFVVSWHEEMQKGAEASSARLRNYVMFVCHLFSFGLLHSALIYDILKKLTSQLTAHSVDQMILVMNSVGFLLRKEDPLSLKDFIVAVQREGSSSNIPQLQLLNTMLRAIKNNNESKMPDYDPTYTEHLRKLLKSYVGGDLKVTALRVTLDDLLHSETRGRWWIVGSAWTGGSLMQAYKPSDHANAAKSLSTETKFSAEFMKMAESMRITRPPKINILFALTVGSDSVEEAIIKLKELSLAPSQEKLIFDVMLYCVQKMRVYKSFYAILSSRMCDNEHKYKRLLQHALWDKLSDIDAIKSKELKNMAKFILQIVKEDALNLSVLKTLPFAETNQKIVGFLEDVFCQLFKHEEGDHVSYDAFKKLFLSKKLQPLRLQFKLFIQVFIMPKCESGELDTRCRQRVERVIDLLSSDMGALL